MIEARSGSAWSVCRLNPLQSCAGSCQLPKTGGTATLPLFPSSFPSGGRFDCQEELATSFCHSVLGATEGRKLALLGAGAHNLHLSWERPQVCQWLSLPGSHVFQVTGKGI